METRRAHCKQIYGDIFVMLHTCIGASLGLKWSMSRELSQQLMQVHAG